MWVKRFRLSLGLTAFVAFACGGEDSSEPAAPGAAAVCDVDVDCEGGRCDPLRGCVACLFDHDCADGQRCDARECRDVIRCEGTSDCRDTLTPVCDEASETCVACLEDADCPGAAHCVAWRCEPYSACATTAECAEGVCDANRGECVECVSSNDCSGSATCLANRCATPCRSEKDCSPTAPFCGPQGYCVECATHAHCPEVYHCAAGRCELDVCEGVAKRCDVAHRAIETCAANGSGFLPTACDASQSCTAESGEPTCVDWVCEPESEVCDDDARYLELCAADGLSVARRIDCADSDEVCVNGECATRTCAPDEYSCENGDLYRCSGDGTLKELAKNCDNDELCSEAEADCIPLSCQPGAPTCDGDELRRCNDRGTGLTGNAERCKRDEACFDGACLERICASDYECDRDVSLQCVDNGTRLVEVERCAPLGELPTYCNPDSGRCETVGCDPSQPICSGDLATVCADDGSGPVAGGVDCTVLEKACFAGTCQPVVCTDEFDCQEGDLYRCEDNGTALRLQGECGRPALCDAEHGTCLAEVCTPGEPVCNGTIATTCDETGAGYEPDGIDCATDDKGCFEGTCQPRVCDADEYFCSEGDVWLCDATSTQSALADDCDFSEHCVPRQATCIANTCSPGAAVCDGTVATVCRSDGSGPEPGGMDCSASNRACRLGICQPLICQPNQRFCHEGNVRLCDATGTASGPYDACLPEEYCDDTAPARCRADLCAANAAACSGERLATCNGDGSGYSDVQDDCAESGLVCTLAGTCASSATDTLGGIDLYAQNPGATLELTALEVLTPRTIIGLEAYFAVSTETEVVWLVYKSSVSTGVYTKLFEFTTTASAGLASYHSSGAIGVTLEGGAYYAIGVLIRGAHTEYWSAIAAEPASFAAIVGEARSDTDSAPGEIWIEGVWGGEPGFRVRTEASERL